MPRILRPNPATHALRITALPDLRLGNPLILLLGEDTLTGERAGAADVDVRGGLRGGRHGFGEHEEEVEGQGGCHGGVKTVLFRG